MKHAGDISAFLEAALADLPEQCSTQRILNGCAKHWAMLIRWQSRANLTAILDPERAALEHYRDSLILAPHLCGGAVVDMGSGAGFPGIPLAFTDPARPVWLVEPRRKRASFLRTAAAQLNLTNVTVLEARVEEQPPRQFAQLVTRATFSDEHFKRQCLRWLEPGGTCFFLVSDTAENLEEAETVRYFVGSKAHRIEIART